MIDGREVPDAWKSVTIDDNKCLFLYNRKSLNLSFYPSRLSLFELHDPAFLFLIVAADK